MRIEEQVLRREQMTHLKELGVDTSDASMCWAGDDVVSNNGMALDLGFDGIPTYTIGDLIEKLPKSVDGDTLLFEFCFSDVGYGNWECSELYGINGQQNFKDKPLKDALYNLLCWVAKKHKELIK